MSFERETVQKKVARTCYGQTSCFFGSLLLCVALFVGALPFAAQAQDGDAAVKFRKSLMQEVKASLQASSLLLKGEVSDPKSLALQAQILALASERGGQAFLYRSRGLVESTTAHERVWTEQKKFQDLMATFAKDTKAFSEQVASGASAKNMRAAFGGLAKQCKSCHDRYRLEHAH